VHGSLGGRTLWHILSRLTSSPPLRTTHPLAGTPRRRDVASITARHGTHTCIRSFEP
jgi:hypothetical protein